MGLREIIPETKKYEADIYEHHWEIETKILSYKAKQEYLANMLKNRKVKNDEIDFANIEGKNLVNVFSILFFNGLKSLKIDGQEETIDSSTYEYLIENLRLACEWIQACILETNGDFFLMKK